MGKKIAIIEDDQDILKLLTVVLQGRGYEVYGAANGLDIVPKLVAEKPDLLIVDLMLPMVEGERLVETFHKKEVTSGVPVVILSAKSEDEIRKAAAAMGARAWLKKPFENSALLELVKAQIG